MTDAPPLPALPIRDYRQGGLLGYASDHAPKARLLMDTVLRGFGPAAWALRQMLPWGDRIAARRLLRSEDPYREEILAIRQALGVPGPVAFALSYEFGCTARGFPDQDVLFRSLDWPFSGLGAIAELVWLRGPAGEWVTVTWPGVAGVLHGTAPGRFALSLNQAPERQSGFGRAVDWLASRRRGARSFGLPPTHLLRQVFETAKDACTARKMLEETEVAAPVIFTLLAPGGEALTIERLEAEAKTQQGALAANHFTGRSQGRWRARGFDSHGRMAMAQRFEHPPRLDALQPPVLNPLTRLAVNMHLDGRLSACGYEQERPVTAVTETSLPADARESEPRQHAPHRPIASLG
ncbi:MAG: hypothetical protein AAFR17_12830 [Pseudomonadota bacterium]